MPVQMMISFSRNVNPKYKFYERTGFREGLPVPNDSAAESIVADMIEDGYYIDFVEAMIRLETEGYMGRYYKLNGLNNVVAGLLQEGFSFDKVTGQFFENLRERISNNWGRLLEGDERKMAVLRLDIAGNSKLVKSNPRNKINEAYNDLRNIVSQAVTSRLGRLWSWEGDGALSAFLFGPVEEMAIYAGMEILHELFFYNRLHNPLDSPINIRIGASIGQIRYSENEMERQKNDTVKQAIALEALAPNNGLCIPYTLYFNLDQVTLSLFSPEKSNRAMKFKVYTMGVEK